MATGGERCRQRNCGGSGECAGGLPGQPTTDCGAGTGRELVRLLKVGLRLGSWTEATGSF